MNKSESDAKLAEIKLTLARKYENLAKVTKSKPRQKTLLHHAAKARCQASNLSKK